MINVTGMKFYDHLQGCGGGGAIDLVIHGRGCSPAVAIRWLAGKPFVPEIEETVAPAVAKAFVPPEACEHCWPRVRAWLIEERGLEDFRVDGFKSTGMLYADARRQAVSFPARSFGVRGDAGKPERRHLVLHQGDQRRHHHREAVHDQSRHLEAQRLARARRHRRERIAARQQGFDHRLLPRTERLEPEYLRQHPARSRIFSGVISATGVRHIPSKVRMVRFGVAPSCVSLRAVSCAVARASLPYRSAIPGHFGCPPVLPPGGGFPGGVRHEMVQPYVFWTVRRQ